MRRSVLSVIHQAGAARALAPVLRRLSELDQLLDVRASPFAAGALADERLAHRVLEACEPREAAAVAAALLGSSPADVLLTGTSVGGTIEQAVVKAGREARVPSVALLDSWTNYAPRFAGATDPLEFLPDRLAVMDTMSRSEIFALGAPDTRIVVTGHPGLDRIRPAASDERFELRERFGAKRDDRVVLFASEPIGGAELTTLASLLRVLEDSALGRSHVLVKPHPTEAAGGLSDVVRAAGQVPAAIVETASTAALVAVADVVVGMTSILLIEAALAGARAVSYRPGVQGSDTFFGRSLGVTESAYDADALRRMLLGGDTDAQRHERSARTRARLGLDGGAAERVATLVITAEPSL